MSLVLGSPCFSQGVFWELGLAARFRRTSCADEIGEVLASVCSPSSVGRSGSRIHLRDRARASGSGCRGPSGSRARPAARAVSCLHQGCEITPINDSRASATIFLLGRRNTSNDASIVLAALEVCTCPNTRCRFRRVHAAESSPGHAFCRPGSLGVFATRPTHGFREAPRVRADFRWIDQALLRLVHEPIGRRPHALAELVFGEVVYQRRERGRLPEPVGRSTSTRPRGFSAISANTFGAFELSRRRCRRNVASHRTGASVLVERFTRSGPGPATPPPGISKEKSHSPSFLRTPFARVVHDS